MRSPAAQAAPGEYLHRIRFEALHLAEKTDRQTNADEAREQHDGYGDEADHEIFERVHQHQYFEPAQHEQHGVEEFVDQLPKAAEMTARFFRDGKEPAVVADEQAG